MTSGKVIRAFIEMGKALVHKPFVAGIFIFALSFILFFVTSGDYGEGQDEILWFNNGDFYVKFLLTLDKKYLGKGDTLLGPFANTLSSFSNYFLNEKWSLLSEIKARHLTNFLFASLFLFTAYFIALKMFGYGIAILAPALMILVPEFFCNAHNNSSDIPAAGVFSAAMLFYYTGDQSKRKIHYVLAAVLTGVTFCTRSPNAITLVVILFFWSIPQMARIASRFDWKLLSSLSILFGALLFISSAVFVYISGILKKDLVTILEVKIRTYNIFGPLIAGFFLFFGILHLHRISGFFRSGQVKERIGASFFLKKYAPKYLILILPVFLVIVMLWPLFWYRPLHYFVKVPATMLQARGLVPGLFFGRMYLKGVPWFYPWVIFGITVPVLIVLLIFPGLFFAVRKNRSGTALLLAWILFSLGKHVTRQGNYHGIRHFFDALAPACILAGAGLYGLYGILSKALKIFFGEKGSGVSFLFLGLAGILLSIPVLKEYPFRGLQFNGLAGGIRGAEGKFDLEYGHDLYNDGIEWLNKEAEEGAQVLVPDKDDLTGRYIRKDMHVLSLIRGNHLLIGDPFRLSWYAKRKSKARMNNIIQKELQKFNGEKKRFMKNTEKAYLLYTTRWPHINRFIEALEDKVTLVHSYSRDGVPLMRIVRFSSSMKDPEREEILHRLILLSNPVTAVNSTEVR